VQDPPVKQVETTVVEVVEVVEIAWPTRGTLMVTMLPAGADNTP
jgi:hypothetical protein